MLGYKKKKIEVMLMLDVNTGISESLVTMVVSYQCEFECSGNDSIERESLKIQLTEAITEGQRFWNR